MAGLDCPMSFLGMLIHRCPLSVGLLSHLCVPLFLVSTTSKYANSQGMLGLGHYMALNTLTIQTQALSSSPHAGQSLWSKHPMPLGKGPCISHIFLILQDVLLVHVRN